MSVYKSEYTHTHTHCAEAECWSETITAVSWAVQLLEFINTQMQRGRHTGGGGAVNTVRTITETRLC